MNVFFTSDTHFGHTKIIKYCKRPFENIYHMDETIIANWNNVVKPGDEVYHLGDFCWGKTLEDIQKYRKRLNGKIYLIKGNHDKLEMCTYGDFEWVKEIYDYQKDHLLITLCHFSMRAWNKSCRGSYHLYGHSHGTLPGIGKSFDVGVDAQNFTPVSLEQVVKIMTKKQELNIDDVKRI